MRRLDPAQRGHQPRHRLRRPLGTREQLIEARVGRLDRKHGGGEKVLRPFVVQRVGRAPPAVVARHSQAVDVGGQALVQVGELAGRVVGRVDGVGALEPEEGGLLEMLLEHRCQRYGAHRGAPIRNVGARLASARATRSTD